MSEHQGPGGVAFNANSTPELIGRASAVFERMACVIGGYALGNGGCELVVLRTHDQQHVGVGGVAAYVIGCVVCDGIDHCITGNVKAVGYLFRADGTELLSHLGDNEICQPAFGYLG